MKNVSILLYDPTYLEPSYMAEDEVLTLGDLTVAEILIVSRQYRLGMHLLVNPPAAKVVRQHLRCPT